MKPARDRPEKNLEGFALVVLLVLITLIVGAWGTVVYFKFSPKPSPSPTTLTYQSPEPVVKPSESPPAKTANWKTYQGKYFSFKHPSHWTENTTSESLRSKLTLETKGLRIGVSVFDADYFDQSYDEALQNFRHRESTQMNIQGKKATKFVTKGIGDPLPIDYSIVTIVVESIPGRNFQINFNGPNKEITNELIDQILSTFRFLE
ncbi:hypothetical protein HY382_00935 [Candidatus Curtissbacteria bacterium]|nr:hypothetical protein [Candidatus Curtissbacteria bacterium]